MNQRNLRGKNRRHWLQLMIEQVESRELLSADLTSSLLAPESALAENTPSVVARETVESLQVNVISVQAEVTGLVFLDDNGNGRQDRRERGIRGAIVELLDGDGQVLATTETDGRGRYTFEAFRRPGDYRLRVVFSDPLEATTDTAQDLRISADDVTPAGAIFGLRLRDSSTSETAGQRDRQLHWFAAIDAALAADDAEIADAALDDFGNTTN